MPNILTVHSKPTPESFRPKQGLPSPNAKIVNIFVQWNSVLRTPAYNGEFRFSRQKAHIFSLKLTRFIRTPVNTENRHFSVSHVTNPALRTLVLVLVRCLDLNLRKDNHVCIVTADITTSWYCMSNNFSVAKIQPPLQQEVTKKAVWKGQLLKVEGKCFGQLNKFNGNTL